MPILVEGLAEYLDAHVPERDAELAAMEEYAKEHGFPIVGPAAGLFLYNIARIVGARRVLELGSGYGYSTAWFAKAVEANGGGTVVHTVWDEDLSRMAREHLGRMGFAEAGSSAGNGTSIEYVVGEALNATKTMSGPFDIVFCDIDKEAYPQAESVAYGLLEAGGLFITDNVLWSGKVVGSDDQDAQTKAIKEFNQKMRDQTKWSSSIVPIRDGLMLGVKQGQN